MLAPCESDLFLLLENIFFRKKRKKRKKKKHFEMLLFCLYAKAFAEVTFLVKEAE